MYKPHPQEFPIPNLTEHMSLEDYNAKQAKLTRMFKTFKI